MRDGGVPRDACNNRSAASCTHPVRPATLSVHLPGILIVSRVHLDHTTGARSPRILGEPWRKRAGS